MVLLWIFRVLFALILILVLFFTVSTESMAREENSISFWAVFWSGFGMGVFAFLVDIFTPKKKLSALAGVFFGLLVGIVISGVLAPAVDIIFQTYKIGVIPEAVSAIKWFLAICICFLTISIVIRTKDDVRFVIPYVEFAKQTKGARPLILDTSVIIDGRIADLYHSKLFDAPLVVPRFVLNELQLIADSADKLKRNRGRRGLEILNRMQKDPAVDIAIDDTLVAQVEDQQNVDQKLVLFTKHHDGRLATTDYNLTKVAQVREVDVLNLNDLANSLKTIALPGEAMEVKIVKAGEEQDQGVGYLADGTMVVVEKGRDKIGRDVTISVTSALQTAQGKMIFGKFESLVQDSNGPNSHNHGRKSGGGSRFAPKRAEI
jgi:uncharacterized protein YacL